VAQNNGNSGDSDLYSVLHVYESMFQGGDDDVLAIDIDDTV
jgi:hypothetical protein